MSTQTTTRERRLTAVMAALLAVAMLGLLAPAAHAQDAPQITTPPTQTAVPVDEPFEVAGTGCPPGSEVTVEAGTMDSATTTADDDGAFSTSLTVPASAFDFDAEPADLNEFTLGGSCDGETIGGVVVVPETQNAEDGQVEQGGQVEQVPAGGVETGAGGTAAAAGGPGAAGSVALLLALGGLLLGGLHRGRRQQA